MHSIWPVENEQKIVTEATFLPIKIARDIVRECHGFQRVPLIIKSMLDTHNISRSGIEFFPKRFEFSSM